MLKKFQTMPRPLSSQRHSHRPIGGGSAFSILGSDTNIAGNVNASTDLHVDGRIEGDIACNALVQGEGSEIAGNVEAESVRIAGRVEGTVTAREVVILKSARIRGDIAYDALTIEQGAQLDGRLTPRGAQGPARVSEANEARLILAAPDKG